MERKLEDVGYLVEKQPGPGLVSAGRKEVGRIADADAKGSDGLETALKKAAAVVRSGLQDRMDEVIGYARREPVVALTAAAVFGFLVGLALATGSRPGAGGGRAWLTQLNSGRNFLGRRTGSDWRGFLRLA